MEPFLAIVRERAQAQPVVVDRALDEALAHLSRALAQIARAVKVEYQGPFVGLGAGREAFCLAVRAHTEAPDRVSWGVRVCSAEPQAHLRAHWEIARVGRLRKAVVVAALPAFVSGYYEAVQAAGKAHTRSGQRLADLVQALDAPI